MTLASSDPRPPANTAWRIENRKESGLFIVSERHGTLLFRIDPKTMTIYPFDKKCKTEVPIALSELAKLYAETVTPPPVFGNQVATAGMV